MRSGEHRTSEIEIDEVDTNLIKTGIGIEDILTSIIERIPPPKGNIEAPLQAMSKAEIVQAGVQQGVDYALTVSCYQADDEGRACGKCDSCRLRAAGFTAAGLVDPTRYF